MAVAEAVKYLARLDDPRVDDGVVDLKPFPAGDDQAVVAEQSEVLGEIRLGQAGDLEQVLDAGLFPLQYIEYFQAL